MKLQYCIASHTIIQPNGALVADFDSRIFPREAQEIVDAHERADECEDYTGKIEELERDLEATEKLAEDRQNELDDAETKVASTLTAHQNTLDELEQVIDEIGAAGEDLTVSTILDMLNKVLADNQIEEGVK